MILKEGIIDEAICSLHIFEDPKWLLRGDERELNTFVIFHRGSIRQASQPLSRAFLPR